uniref:PWWP domain-containing protein n=1 Tax=Timema tahoe TaxID=61484 RepID=A0A7R9FGS8_9NEOP|nr:unnamed protein product [Timema tahoe]
MEEEPEDIPTAKDVLKVGDVYLRALKCQGASEELWSRIYNLPVVITERQVPSKQLYISDRAASSTAVLQRRSDPSLGIKWVTDDEDAWRVNYLIYQPMDLRTMDCKAQNKKYRTLEEFQADAQTIVHNVVIYHGVNSSLADMARQMLRDCIYDLQEIRQCRDCYRMSNEKEDKHWFCQPCKPQHELVYAKQKGFPYWPAKVIKIEGQTYDVRFFGGHHQRAVLDKTYIRPISVNIHTLQVKRTSSWNKACEELKRHRDQLEKLANSSEVDDSSFEDDDDDLDTVCVVHTEYRNSTVRDHETEESIPKLVNESTTVRVPSDDDEDDEDDDEDDDDNEEEEVEQVNSAEKKQSHEITPEEDEPISSSSKNIKDSRKDTNSQEDVVSSSCKEQRSRTLSTQTPARWMKVLSKNENSKVKLAQEFELEKQKALDYAMKNLEERLKAENATQLKDIIEKHNLLISETKRKQWRQYTTVAGTQRTAVSSANKHTGKKNTKKFVGGNVDLSHTGILSLYIVTDSDSQNCFRLHSPGCCERAYRIFSNGLRPGLPSHFLRRILRTFHCFPSPPKGIKVVGGPTES